MEMMVVLLIVAIVAAASAPMVTKKLSRNAGTGDSPWVFTGLRNSIAYNMRGDNNSPVIIGASRVPNSIEGSTRLYIDSGNAASHIAFGNGDATPLLLTADPALGRIGFSNQNIPERSVLFGTGQTLADGITGVISIGHSNTVNGNNSIAIGSQISNVIGTLPVEASANSAIAIGVGSTAGGANSIAIGSGELLATPAATDLTRTFTQNRLSIAIGTGARSSADRGLAVGSNARAQGENSMALGFAAISNNSDTVAIGHSAVTGGNNAISIGNTARANSAGSLAIGNGARGSSQDAIAIGNGAEGTNTDAIAIGWQANAASRSVAIGSQARATSGTSVAIGRLATVSHDNSVAIGSDSRTTANHQIVLGTENDVVWIPGTLVVGRTAEVGGDTYLGTSFLGSSFSGHHFRVFMVRNDGNFTQLTEPNGSGSDIVEAIQVGDPRSDRRLKNVGKSYTAGLDELKRLDFFHYTFKDDKLKTPRVGVMAQDLQKVFPDAVTEGRDGYLRIRLEDMFYAVINAVKELDVRIVSIVDNIAGMKSTIEAQQKTIDAQQTVIEELQKQNSEFLKQNAEFEKRLKKLEKRDK